MMRRRIVVVGVLAFVASVVGVGAALAAPKAYKYRCPKCKLIQEYGTMGSKKCPNDGWTMVRMP